jgi:hypothetical protein
MELLREHGGRRDVQVDARVEGERCPRLVIFSHGLWCAPEAISTWLERERIISPKESR